MPAKRELTMRQIRQMLRLARDGVSAREIGRMLGVARSTIQDNLKRASTAGLAWPLAGDLTDAVLEQRLFAHAGVRRGFRRRREPDWASLACELKRPGVNLTVLWEEYRAVHPEGYGYSRFCDLFREFERRLSPTMRQDHPAGDKVFVDYSGKKIMIVDRQTGVVREAEILSPSLAPPITLTPRRAGRRNWRTGSRPMSGCSAFLAGLPRLVVPDNLKSGVHRLRSTTLKSIAATG
jgi:transposase